MKKIIPLLLICLAVLCFFTSCAELEKLFIQGTWVYDFKSGRNYYSYKVIISEDRIQLIKDEYGLSGHRLPISSDVSEQMPYTVGENGVLTLNYTEGVMKEILVTDTFALDESQGKLIWLQGFSEWGYALSKESNETTFITPKRGYEQYTCERAIYELPGEEVISENSTLYIYSDGQYTWEGVSSGHWEKNGNKISLIDSGGFAFSRMDLDYVVDSETASHLQEDTITGGDFSLLTGFSYDFYKHVEYYH